VSAVTGKPPAAARLTLSQVMGPSEVNLMGTVHGGVVLRLIDEVAGVVAARHSGGPAVTAFVDEMAFLAAVRVGDVVHARGEVSWTGRTSMEVAVDVTADRWDESVPATRVATAFLVMVAVAPDGRPRPVPPVLTGTVDQERRRDEAEARRTRRLASRRDPGTATSPGSDNRHPPDPMRTTDPTKDSRT
jgi:acyl-CoA hydrolase